MQDLLCEIVRQECTKRQYRLVSNVSTEYGVIKNFTSYIISEKTFSPDSVVFDPIIPDFGCEPALDHLRKEMIDLLPAEFDDLILNLIKLSNDFLNIIDSIYNSGITFDNLEISVNKFTRQGKEYFKLILNDELIANIENILGFYYDFNRKVLDKIEIPSKLYNKLIERITQYGFSHSESNIRVVIVIMRYDQITTGQADTAEPLQWNIPEKTMNMYRKKYKVDFELFASPLNVNRNNYFCSLFWDTDRYFGSSGNFVDIVELLDGVIEVNPPFIEVVQNVMAEKLLIRLDDSKPFGVIGVMANWSDSKAYELISNSKYLVWSKVILGKFESARNNLQFNKTNFSVYHFYLSNNE